MAIPAGSEAYSCDSGAVIARGRSLSEQELTVAVQGDISQIMTDYKGNQELHDLFAGLASLVLSKGS